VCYEQSRRENMAKDKKLDESISKRIATIAIEVAKRV